MISEVAADRTSYADWTPEYNWAAIEKLDPVVTVRSSVNPWKREQRQVVSFSSEESRARRQHEAIPSQPGSCGRKMGNRERCRYRDEELLREMKVCACGGTARFESQLCPEQGLAGLPSKSKGRRF